MIAGVADLHPELAFDFALAHVAAVNESVDASSRSSFFPALASTSHDPEMIGKVNAYAKANLAPTARRTAETAVASITDHIRIRRDRLQAIDEWLANRS